MFVFIVTSDSNTNENWSGLSELKPVIAISPASSCPNPKFTAPKRATNKVRDFIRVFFLFIMFKLWGL
jgi:hypothetical protein